jgi:secreted PhoX family phosphatase
VAIGERVNIVARAILVPSHLPENIGMSTRRSVVVVLACVAGGAACSSSTSPTPPTKSPVLWVAGGYSVGSNISNGAIAYTSAQLQASGTPTPAVALSFPVTQGGNIDASGVAFDHHGNMWVVNDNSNTVVEYTTSQITANGSPMPTVTLSLPSGAASYALAFDAKGNLWVANNGANNVVEFTASQLTASGSPTAAITLSQTPQQGGGLQEPIAVAFDATGNLWVADNASSEIIEYTTSQLTTSGSPTPAATLTGAAIAFPNGIAFDASGNLWIANSAYSEQAYGQGRIVEYAANTLASGGSPTPAAVINTPTGTYGSVPTGVAFDNEGNLWYADAYNQEIGEYTTAQLPGANGNVTPTVLIPSVNQFAGVGIAFYPHASNLPLY